MRSRASREFDFTHSTGKMSDEYRRSREYRESDSSEKRQFPRDQSDLDDNSARRDSMPKNNFAGRGPKGYRRSDERIREDVCEALYRHPFVDASDIEVKVIEGEVTLSGAVDSRQSKREAEKSIESIFGVIDVFNELKIKRFDQKQGGGLLKN